MIFECVTYECVCLGMQRTRDWQLRLQRRLRKNSKKAKRNKLGYVFVADDDCNNLRICVSISVVIVMLNII